MRGFVSFPSPAAASRMFVSTSVQTVAAARENWARVKALSPATSDTAGIITMSLMSR